MNNKAGEELNQLSRLLFNEAAKKWYVAIALEVVAGAIATIVGVARFPDNATFILIIVASVMAVSAYVSRLRFHVQYDTAETMRRQSILSEALDWPIDKIQLSEWKQRAGKRLRTAAKTKPRVDGYYDTKKEIGPERLADMMIESAFYTRNLYIKLRTIIWIVFVAATLSVALLLIIALSSPLPSNAGMLISQAVLLFIPTVLSIDLLGWGIKLGGLISGIREVESDLERLVQNKVADLSQVMRIVSEYNCLVTMGMPIHNWLFNKWHDEIKELWDER